jgi:hypothetical protein
MSLRFDPVAALIALGLILAPMASYAAAGVGLRWDACFGDLGPINRDFACDRNTGVDVLVGSFAVYQDMPAVNGLLIALDIQSASAVLPAWWMFRTAGACRSNAVSFTTTPPDGMVACSDWSEGQAIGVLGTYTLDTRRSFSARLIASSAVHASLATALAPEQEYFAFTLRIQHSGTVGSGSCDGCCVPVGVFLSQIVVLAPEPQDQRALSGAMNGSDSDFATWQRYRYLYRYMPEPAPPCGPVPTRSHTWSELKALYR